MSSRLEQLERLVQLRDAGALTAEEFETEKVKVLSSQEASTPPLHVASAQPSYRSAPASPNPAGDGVGDEISWNPFRRPTDVAVAERLSRFGFLAGALMVACDVAALGNLLLKVLTGATYEDGTTYASFLPIVGGVLLLILAIDAGLTVASWRARSRWAAIGLLVMATIAAAGSALELKDGRTIWRLLQFVVTFAAFFCAIQAIRGAFWLKAMGGLGALQRQRAESEREMGRVFDAYMPAPARRRWLAIVTVIAMLIVAVGVGSRLLEQPNDDTVYASVPPVTTASSEAATTNLPETPSEGQVPGLPALVSGTPFAQARQQLIAAGLSPMPIALSGECPGDICQVYPEVIECVGMGSSPDNAVYAPCTLRYRRDADRAWIIVRTTGEYLPDYNQDVEFHDMAVMNAQDRRTLAEIEGQYAALSTR